MEDGIDLPKLASAQEVNDTDFSKLFFYVRLLDNTNLTSFSNADIVQGNGWVIHFYGDGAATCSAYSVLAASEARAMLDALKKGLLDRNLKELELVGFNGNQAMLKQLLVSFKLDPNPIQITGDLVKEISDQNIDAQVNILKSLKTRYNKNNNTPSSTPT